MPTSFPSELTLELGLDEAEDPSALRHHAARALGVPEPELPRLVPRRRSIDARRGRVRLCWLVELGAAPDAALGGAPPRELRGPARTLILGDGPAGLFAAYQLARRGVACTVLERGKQVQPRRHDLKLLQRRGVVDPDSNYCFGEGGAGTYSDGKLYTRAHKRGNVRDVLELLVLHGAPEHLLTDARPHIGSNRLPKVVQALRERLEGVGVGFRFGARAVGLLTRGGGADRRVAGVRLEGGEELEAERVVLATGHSARDVYDWLAALGVPLEPKGFAVGVRIEHPQQLIDQRQYGRFAGHPKLPSAAYRVVKQVEGRGVFSFCMCPGGWVVPAATAPEELVVNGMSLSRRDSPYANSGLVVAVEPSDWESAGYVGALGGVELQRRLERAAFAAGGGAQVAPAQRASDFLARRRSRSLPESSYIPGLREAPLDEVLDVAGVGLNARLGRALSAFERTIPGYAGEEAVLIGVESRTSSPVRVPRDPVTLEAPGLAGLYPCGEGSGHAGGIVSAAVDGVRVAEAIAQALGGGG